MYICPGIQPYALSEPIRNLSVVNLNYTNQDFWSMKTRLIQFIKERFVDDFNDFVESSLAIMLIENFAFIADTLSFKIDQIANEIFIDTVTELDNAFRLSKLVGFKPTPPIGAKSLWLATISTPLAQDITIPTPFEVTIPAEDQSITVELFPADADNNAIYTEDIVIPAGAIEVSGIVGVEGKTLDDTFIGNGEISQGYLLDHENIIMDSISVYVDGVQWAQVDYFTDSQPRREFIVEYNSDYSVWVIFGNNRAGLIPSQGSRIQILYRIGTGTAGNIVTTFTTQSTVPLNHYPYNLPVTFSNYTSGQYGYNGDTIEDIRRKLPEYLRTQDRAVTGLDYKTLADQYASAFHGQIGKSIASLRNYGCAANIVDLFVLAREGENGLTEASDQLKVELQNYINTKKMFTDEVCIKDGIVVEVDVFMELTVSRLYRKFEEEIKAKINRKMALFFNLAYWDYNQDLNSIDIIKALSDIQEITSFSITLDTNDPNNSGDIVTTKYYEIIRPDAINVSFTYI